MLLHSSLPPHVAPRTLLRLTLSPQSASFTGSACLILHGSWLSNCVGSVVTHVLWCVIRILRNEQQLWMFPALLDGTRRGRFPAARSIRLLLVSRDSESCGPMPERRITCARDWLRVAYACAGMLWCAGVTLCMMMWHYVWWCDTMYDDVTLCAGLLWCAGPPQSHGANSSRWIFFSTSRNAELRVFLFIWYFCFFPDCSGSQSIGGRKVAVPLALLSHHVSHHHALCHIIKVAVPWAAANCTGAYVVNLENKVETLIVSPKKNISSIFVCYIPVWARNSTY